MSNSICTNANAAEVAHYGDLLRIYTEVQSHFLLEYTAHRINHFAKFGAACFGGKVWAFVRCVAADNFVSGAAIVFFVQLHIERCTDAAGQADVINHNFMRGAGDPVSCAGTCAADVRGDGLHAGRPA